jgi:hypothetical protein
MFDSLLAFVRELDWGQVMIWLGIFDLTFFTGVLPATALVLTLKKLTTLISTPNGKGDNKDEHLRINGKGVGFEIEKSLALNLLFVAIGACVVGAVLLAWKGEAMGCFPNRVK